MNTLQTDRHNMPIDEEKRRAGSPSHQSSPHREKETRHSWLQMAQVGFPGNPICTPEILFGDPHLQIAISGGHTLAMQLDVLPAALAHQIIDSPVAARRLRLYLAAVEGELDAVFNLTAAEIDLGIRNQDGTLKGEWK